MYFIIINNGTLIQYFNSLFVQRKNITLKEKRMKEEVEKTIKIVLNN